jgi:hypothetical protein
MAVAEESGKKRGERRGEGSGERVIEERRPPPAEA